MAAKQLRNGGIGTDAMRGGIGRGEATGSIVGVGGERKVVAVAVSVSRDYRSHKGRTRSVGWKNGPVGGKLGGRMGQNAVSWVEEWVRAYQN
jgi:hypothetical protein